MREVPLSHDGPLLIENAHLVLFRAPVHPDKPRKSLFSHRSLPPSHGPSRRLPSLYLALEGATSYWASVVANPPGHMSVFGASKRGASLVAPGEPARPVSLRRV